MINVRSLANLKRPLVGVAAPTRKQPRTDQADVLWWQMKAIDAHHDWDREFIFHPTRKWRFDLAHVPLKLAVEVEGLGVGGSAGRHQRIGGFQGDIEKYAEAFALGWRILRVTTKYIKSGRALSWIEQAMTGER